MAFDNTLTLTNNGAESESFVAQSRLQGGVDYIDVTSTAANTRKLSIRHTNAGPSVIKGGKPVRRHLVQMVQEKWNSTLGKTERATVNVTITVDPGASITLAEQQDLIAMASNFVDVDANVEKLLRDEA